MHHIAKKHFGFQGLYHVLGLVYLAVSLFDLLSTQLILEVLFFSIHDSASNLQNQNLKLLTSSSSSLLILSSSLFSRRASKVLGQFLIRFLLVS